MGRIKLVRITTVPISLEKLIAGQIRFMVEAGFNVTMVSSDSAKRHCLEEREHAKFLPVNMKRQISPLNDIISLCKLIKLFYSIKPVIVHTHTPKAGLLGMLAAKITGVPVRIHTVAGLPLMETTGTRRKILEFAERLTYKCADQVYPNSENLRSFILNSHLSRPGKVKVIGNGSSNGIDTNYFMKSDEVQVEARKLSELYNLSSANFTYIFIGRLVKDKGIEELVDAFDVLCHDVPEIRLLLVGPEEKELDPLSDKCLQRIRNNRAIIAVGYQSDIRPYLAISNALAFPSYREGFPNVPMQAGCFNLPCIVTDINGCNEIIIHRENGLIIPVKDVESLRLAMKTLYLNTELYQKMVEKSRKMITDRYEQHRMWELILEEYTSHLNRKKIVYKYYKADI